MLTASNVWMELWHLEIYLFWCPRWNRYGGWRIRNWYGGWRISLQMRREGFFLKGLLLEVYTQGWKSQENSEAVPLGRNNFLPMHLKQTFKTRDPHSIATAPNTHGIQNNIMIKLCILLIATCKFKSVNYCETNKQTIFKRGLTIWK